MAYGAHTTGFSTATGSSNMRISEVYGAHMTTTACSTAADPMHMRINEVHGVHTQQSMEGMQCHMETTPHVDDYIPMDSAGNTTWPLVTTDISGTDISASGVTNPLSIID